MRTVVCIPTKRKPPVLTLQNYDLRGHYQIFIVADPAVYLEHDEYYATHGQASVHLGETGLGAQVFECYRLAERHGFTHFVKLDDDIEQGSFVERVDEGGRIRTHRPDLLRVITQMETCMEMTGLSLVGLASTSNPFYLKPGFVRSRGGLLGACNLAVTTDTPELFIDPKLKRLEEVYRVCAHRKFDLMRGGKGRVGRVGHIGVDLARFFGIMTSCNITQEDVDAATQQIKTAFPGYVEFEPWANSHANRPYNMPRVRYVG